MARWDLQNVHKDVELFCRFLRLKVFYRAFRRHPVRTLVRLMSAH